MGVDAVFYPFLLVVAVVSGVTASLTGFGIGSLLTPLLASRYGMATAIAAVALPHAFATAVRCWRLRASIDRGVLRRFGIVSAAGSLAGALLYANLGGPALTRILGVLLIGTAAFNLVAAARAWRPGRAVVWGLGLVSGLFGGVAGNQGGLRAVALSSLGLWGPALVATATATGLLVDAVRTPIYLYRAGATLVPLAAPVAVAAAGVLAGTIAGERLLTALPPERFRPVLAVMVGLLGVFLLWTAD
jgi:uncharacterized membrane protein YfcA